MSTILSQLILPTSIEKYSPEDQETITEFLSILQDFEVNTSEKRESFMGLMDTYIDKYYLNYEEYYRLPFLWFAIDYFNVARRILSVTGFYPDDFYQYLVQHFRGNSETQGIFDLIRTTTPLTDLKWEKLQYLCNKFTIALTDDELLALEVVFSYISTSGPRALNQQRLKTIIGSRVKNRRFIRRLNRFFTLLDAQWLIRFYPPAFGLERLYFHFQLNESVSLAEILDFQNPTNVTLGASYVYRIDEFHNYLGIIWVPTQALKPMQDYLKHKEKQGLLILNGLDRIIDTQVSWSLLLYEPGKGWRSLNTSEYQRLKHRLKPSTIIKKKSEPRQFFLGKPFNKNWYFKRENGDWKPDQYINICCKISSPIRFNNLSSVGHSQKNNDLFSKTELQLLTELYRIQVLQVYFDPLRLSRDFSLDQYWIQVPITIPFEKLRFLLSYLPTTNIFFTENFFYIWTILTSEIFKFLAYDIGWNVYRITALYWEKPFDTRWFDFQSKEWKIPNELKTLGN
ncbi:MAG: hypothetical protein ACFE95_00305 [Candidatus Hodarchaeota archaeon]